MNPTMTDEEFSARLIDEARAVAARYPAGGLLTPADIESELVECGWRERDRLRVTLAESPAMFVNRLNQYAGTLYRKARIRELRQTGNYFYDVEYVRLFLPYLFALEDWSAGPPPEDAPSYEWATGEALDTAIDLTAAFRRLRPAEQAVIVARHGVAPADGGEVDWQRIADIVGAASAEAADRQYRRATEALTVEANIGRRGRLRGHDGPGSRRAISNARATTTIRKAEKR